MDSTEFPVIPLHDESQYCGPLTDYLDFLRDISSLIEKIVQRDQFSSPSVKRFCRAKEKTFKNGLHYNVKRPTTAMKTAIRRLNALYADNHFGSKIRCETFVVVKQMSRSRPKSNPDVLEFKCHSGKRPDWLSFLASFVVLNEATPFSTGSIPKTLLEVEGNKFCGFDWFPPFSLKACARHTAAPLLKHFNINRSENRVRCPLPENGFDSYISLCKTCCMCSSECSRSPYCPLVWENWVLHTLVLQFITTCILIFLLCYSPEILYWLELKGFYSYHQIRKITCAV